MHKEWMLKGKAFGMGQGLGIQAARNQIDVPLKKYLAARSLVGQPNLHRLKVSTPTEKGSH